MEVPIVILALGGWPPSPRGRAFRGGGTIQEAVYAVILGSITLAAVMIFLIEKTGLRKAYSRIFRFYAPHPAGPQEGRP